MYKAEENIFVQQITRNYKSCNLEKKKEEGGENWKKGYKREQNDVSSMLKWTVSLELHNRGANPSTTLKVRINDNVIEMEKALENIV